MSKWIAILDEKGVLTGFDKNPATIPEGSVTVPENCDLRPGRYIWTGKAFWPIIKDNRVLKQKIIKEAPYCLYLLIKILMADKMIQIPEEIKGWMKDYEILKERET